MIAGLWNYWVVVVLMMIGLFTLISRRNLIKKMLGLNMFQVSVIMLYVSMAKVEGGTAPILLVGSPSSHYSNPLPHVLMLTAIVVGVATTALGLALTVRIREAYGTIEEDELLAIDARDAEALADLDPDAAADRPAVGESHGDAHGDAHGGPA
jgi:multicomponent Na+:H+ antiporter subunit C